MGNVDDEELEEARRVLVAVLAAVEAGELEAPRRVVDQLRGAVAALDTLTLAASGHLR